MKLCGKLKLRFFQVQNYLKFYVSYLSLLELHFIYIFGDCWWPVIGYLKFFYYTDVSMIPFLIMIPFPYLRICLDLHLLSYFRKMLPRKIVSLYLILQLFIFKLFIVTSFRDVSRIPATSLMDPYVTLINSIT